MDSLSASHLRPILRLLLTIACLYGLSLGGLLATGRQPAVPWEFIPHLLFVSIPQAVALIVVMGLVMPRAGWSNPTWGVVAACCLFGILATFGGQAPFASFVIGIGTVIFTIPRWRRREVVTTALSIIVLLVGYATVWNGNYLLALATTHRLWDAALIAFDMRALSLLGWELSSYDGALPLVSSALWFTLLENSYLFLFPQVIALLLWLAATGSPQDVARWLTLLFGTYAVGLLGFAVVPAVGPPIYHPESFHAGLRETLTFQIMSAMAGEYQQVIAGRALNGFGYFVALPSLHVAVAALSQRAWRSAPLLYWTFLPINALLIASTVLLGYHYLLDLPAGLLVGTFLGRYLTPQVAVPWPRRAGA